NPASFLGVSGPFVISRSPVRIRPSAPLPLASRAYETTRAADTMWWTARDSNHASPPKFRDLRPKWRSPAGIRRFMRSRTAAVASELRSSDEPPQEGASLLEQRQGQRVDLPSPPPAGRGGRGPRHDCERDVRPRGDARRARGAGREASRGGGRPALE